jgi:peptidoglycan/LPS O-acetylase OafA/YrhL
MQEQERAEFATVLRGIAALLVLLSHYLGVFWLRRDDVAGLIFMPALSLEQHRVPVYVAWLNSVPLVRWGSLGVALFFLISGFVIPFSLSKATAASFAVNRLFRIVPTYAVGFTLALVALWFGTRYFGRPWPLGTREILIHYVPGLRDLFGLRSIDGIVWTLEVEMKFYAICAVSIVLFRKRPLALLVVPCLVFLAAMGIGCFMPGWARTDAHLYWMFFPFLFSSSSIVYMFIGTSLFFVQRGYIAERHGYLLSMALFCATVLLWNGIDLGIPVYRAWSYGFAFLIFAAGFSFQKLFVRNRITSFLADISYPLYVIHGVAGYVLLRLLLEWGWKRWQALILVTVLAFILSWIIHKWIEAPTQKIGKRIASRLYEGWVRNAKGRAAAAPDARRSLEDRA